MPILPWTARFDLGVPEMNAQHKGLLDLMNKIYDMNEAGASHGQELPPSEMEALIRSAGRVPRQRTTKYADAPADLRQPRLTFP